MSQRKAKKPAKKAEGPRRAPAPKRASGAGSAAKADEPTHSREAVSRAVADAAEAAAKLRSTPSTLAGTRQPGVAPTLPVSGALESAAPESRAPTVDAT